MIPIFDELLYAEKLLANGFVKFMSRKDLIILAKFYFFKGLDEEQIRKKLNMFCYKYNPEYNEIIFGNSIDTAIKKSKQSALSIPSDIFITKHEIDCIKRVSNYRVEKILFVILVCSKFYKQSSDIWHKNKDSEYWSTRFSVNAVLSPYLSLAKVYANRQEQESIVYDLIDKGYLLSDVNNPSKDGWLEVLYADNACQPEDVFAVISSRDNMIDFYPPYLVCLGCGKEIEKDHNSRKYCGDCWKEKKKEIDREYIKKTYKKKKLS